MGLKGEEEITVDPCGTGRVEMDIIGKVGEPDIIVGNDRPTLNPGQIPKEPIGHPHAYIQVRAFSQADGGHQDATTGERGAQEGSGGFTLRRKGDLKVRTSTRHVVDPRMDDDGVAGG